MSQLGTQYEGRTLLFTSGSARQVKWRGKLNLKTGEKNWHTVLCCSRSNKVSCRNHSSTPGISIHAFQKETKKTNMDDLHQDSHAQTGLESKHFALCSEHFKSLYFSRSVLIGTPVDFKRFHLEEGSVPSIYTTPKDSLDIDYSRNEGRLANRFFPEKRSLDVSLRPYRETSVSKIPTPPPKKKIISFRTGQAYSRYAFDLPR